MNPRRPRRRGVTTLTLTEVTVVFAIIMLLVALLLPAVNAAREAARRVQCTNNLMQLGIALHAYEATHGVLPPGVINDTGPIANVPTGYHFGWLTQVLPFVDRRSLRDHMDDRVSLYDPANLTSRQTVLRSLLCPSDPGPVRETDGAAATSYAACHHDSETPIGAKNNGSFFLNSRIRYEDIPDGVSSTIFVGETPRSAGDLGWASGTRASLRNASGFGGGASAAGPPSPAGPGSGSGEETYAVGGYGSFHPGGANFLFGDGSVRFVRRTISFSIFRLLASRADGELLDAHEF